MGQKINPTSFRLTITKDWQGKWFATKTKYRHNLMEDFKIRALIKKRYNHSISKIEIHRHQNDAEIYLYTSKPGIIIGRQGQGIAELTKQTEKLIKHPIKINILPIKRPELSACLSAENIGQQLIKRMSYRRAIKQAISNTMQSGAKGILVIISGRLNGAEIARTEKFKEGSIPLSTLRAKIDYSNYHAITTWGVIGVKVWIHGGEKWQ